MTFGNKMYFNMPDGLAEISIMGSFEVVDGEGNAFRFPTLSSEGLVAILAINFPNPVPRDDLALALWPESEHRLRRSNLRKTIQRTKSVLPSGVVLESQKGLSLDSDLIDCDVWRAKQIEQELLVLTEHQDMIPLLLQEWKIRSQVFLEGWDDDWVLQERASHEFGLVELGLKLSRLLLDRGRKSEALEVQLKVLDRIPVNAELLEQVVELENDVFGLNQALNFASQFKVRLALECGADLPANVQRLLRSIQSGTYQSSPKVGQFATRSELVLLSRLVQQAIETGSPHIIEFLKTELTSQLAWSHVHSSFEIAKAAMDSPAFSDELKAELVPKVLMMASYLGEYEIAHEWASSAYRVLDKSSPEYSSVLAMDGFISFEHRDFLRATKLVTESVNLCEKFGRPVQRLQNLSQWAGVMWHQLKFDDAKAAYQEILDATRASETESGKRLFFTTMANFCYLYSYFDQPEKARPYGEYCIDDHLHHSIAVGCTYLAPYGYSCAATGSLQLAMELLQESVRKTNHHGFLRYFHLSLDFVMAALLLLGEAEQAFRILEQSLAFRNIFGHTHSPAEEKFVADKFERFSNFKFEQALPKNSMSINDFSIWLTQYLDELAFKVKLD